MSDRFRRPNISFEGLLEAAPDAMVVVDEAGHILLVNAQAERMFEYGRAELVGKSIEDLVPERYRGDHLQHRRRFFEHPSVRPMGAGLELHGRRRDGAEFPVEISLSPMHTDQGMVAIAAIRDSTERKDAEVRFRGLLESAPDAIVIVDGGGRIVLVNAQTEKLFGYNRTELINQPIEILVPERSRGKHGAQRDSYIKSPAARPMGAGLALHGRRKDGTEFPVEISLSPIETKEGTLVASAIRDISERTEAEARFRGLLESAPDAIVIADAKGHIILVNVQAERLFGYNRVELIGQPVETLVPERYRGGHVRHRENYTHDPSVRPMGAGLELYGLRKDGAEFPVEISLSPIETKQGTVVASAIRDITDRKKAEQERVELYQEQVARREAETANRMKDEFLSVLSHELRTPLNAILGWAHMLDAGALDEPTRAKAVKTIVRNAMAQSELVSDILDLSRITSGKIHLSVRAVALSKIVEAAIDSVRPTADAKGVRLTTLLDDDGASVSADPDRLQQVAWNLLTNAIKFTPRGGRVFVKLERVDTAVQLTVQDTGVGIDSEFLPHVFDAFRQADSSASRTHGGLGLGLAIVRHLVELHGGRVWAASQGRDAGATFTVELPLAHAGAATEPEVAPLAVAAESALHRAPALHGVRVLLVEDEIDSREMIETLLRGLGAEVLSAADAQEGFSRIQTDRPDVLVSDIGLPLEDGYALMRRIRDLPVERGGLTPAIALTAHARVEDRLRALSTGFQHHVAKPVNPRELGTVIASLVGRVRVTEPTGQP